MGGERREGGRGVKENVSRERKNYTLQGPYLRVEKEKKNEQGKGEGSFREYCGE